MFTEAVSTSNYTLASHASMFTGLYPSEHGARYWTGYGDAPLPAGIPVMAELLAKAHYATAAVVANTLYLAPEYGMARGFARYDSRWPTASLPRLSTRFALRRGLHAIAAAWRPLRFLTRAYRTADAINRAAAALLDDRTFTSGPFFLFCNYMDAHSPYLPPGAFADRLDAGRNGASVARYDGAIAYLDAQVGQLIKTLQARNLYDNTLLIIVSDHGEGFGEHGDQEHPASLYQDQIHVLLLVKWPHQRAGAVVSKVVSGVDVLPTVLGVAGVAVPPGVQGRNLAAPVAANPRSVFAEDFFGNANAADPSPSQAIIQGYMKLIVYEDGRREAFDVVRDPDERRNLYRSNEPTYQRMEQALQEWRRRARPGPSTPLPSRTILERLRSLGYVQ